VNGHLTDWGQNLGVRVIQSTNSVVVF
jgi:hypothetical protein